MLISYDDYKNKYNTSKLASEIFESYSDVLHLYFYSQIVYTESQIKKRRDIESIKNAMLYQISYFEEFGLYDDGIVSQSASGVSETLNNKKAKGELNISKIFEKHLQPLKVMGKL